MSSSMEMKVTMKKPIKFYTNSAEAFLKGIEARPASEGKEAQEAKPPVDELKISGLGEAIQTAVAAAAKVEADGLAKIAKIETTYPEMPSGRGCAHIVVTLRKK
eukprot:TRINITY_DN33084_c0_g1_i1.p3 TRINITY_DN33084_c0_g1~~TRINITY_DN33084_c0_g1_i1.p3  ORF type:complete len:104 (+),score=36.19 TRINITY_DN33084_c0_g1_i1:95-406(+)